MKHPLNDLNKDVYSVRTEGEAYRVTKFNAELNPVSFYRIVEEGEDQAICNCPQSNRGHCRHIDILDAFQIYPDRIDKGWFYCHETRDWFPPLEGAAAVEDPPSGDPQSVESAMPPPADSALGTFKMRRPK